MSSSASAVRTALRTVSCALFIWGGSHASANSTVASNEETIDRVVVTASGFLQKIENAPASITVLSRDELESRAYHGLAEALAEVEGIDIGDAVDKTGAPSISIRGMPSEYTLILIDGRRQNVAGNVAPNGFGGTQNNFIPPLAAIERIEVIRGPMSTLYGSDAMGGVVNIITRKVDTDWSSLIGVDHVAQADSRFGDSSSANASLSGPLIADRLGFFVHGAIYDRDAANVCYSDSSGDEVVPWMGANPVSYTNHNVGARLHWLITDAQELSLEGSINRQKYDNSKGQVGTLGSGGYGPVQRYHREQITLAHTARFDFGTLESSVMRNTTETIGRLIPVGVPGAGSPRALENDNLVFDTKLTSNIGRHVVTFGGQWWESEMVDAVAAQPFEHEQWAMFVEDEWRFADSMSLTVGVRRDDHSMFGGHTSPRAYLVWNASGHWTLKGGVSAGYKTPRLDQLADGIVGFGGQGTIPLIGSPGLKPETSTSTELGLYFDNRRGMRANVTLFNNDFEDKIATGAPIANCHFNNFQQPCLDLGPQWTRSPTFAQSVNIDEAVTRGVEVASSLQLAADWSLDLNYTYVDSEQKSGAGAGLPLANTPEHMVNAKIDWTLSERVGLYVRGEHRSDRFRGAGAAQTGLGNYKAYSLAHVGGRYQLTDHVSLNAAIYNVFDKDFIDFQPYVNDASTGALAYANMYPNSDEGRRFWLSANVTF